MRSRVRPRRPTGVGEWAAAAVAVLFGGLLLYEAVQALLSHWYLTAAAVLVPSATVAARLRRRATARRRRAERVAHLRLDLVADIDRLDPTAFEYAVQDLMIRDGIDAERVGGAGDKAADVIGRDQDGRVIVVQCKHTITEAKVGARVIYQVNGTAEHAHGADDAVVVTNGSFTRDATKYAAEVGIHLVDRDGLRAWAEEGVALQELLLLGVVRRRWRGQRGRLRRHRRRISVTVPAKARHLP
ncbi:restriction endonuclease [Nonomuraea zeae]|uniref:Restriction endonuclease n=1 Tax=Nonomuraea zeae TaxID=1642303 RepID=A0A5S4GU00_9ACTN|nr:restriction endonuclease [Nonomuraea zeae]TMR29900.1 restriction endonuclease [Nonomuraea zeae]